MSLGWIRLCTARLPKRRWSDRMVLGDGLEGVPRPGCQSSRALAAGIFNEPRLRAMAVVCAGWVGAVRRGGM